MSDPFKTALRHTIKQVRSKVSLTYRATSSRQICNRIQTLEQYRQAKRIALYFAINGEVDLNSLWNSAPMQGKFCYFPALNEENKLSFLPATPNTPFKKNRYHIPEPDISMDLAISDEALDLILMPLVAFDSNCTRLGMGAGYYDRTLAYNHKSTLIGVAYTFQHVSFIEAQPWDIPLDAVVTPQSIYWRP